jgi:hypothetical protein
MEMPVPTIIYSEAESQHFLLGTWCRPWPSGSAQACLSPSSTVQGPGRFELDSAGSLTRSRPRMGSSCDAGAGRLPHCTESWSTMAAGALLGRRLLP